MCKEPIKTCSAQAQTRRMFYEQPRSVMSGNKINSRKDATPKACTRYYWSPIIGPFRLTSNRGEKRTWWRRAGRFLAPVRFWARVKGSSKCIEMVRKHTLCTVPKAQVIQTKLELSASPTPTSYRPLNRQGELALIKSNTLLCCAD